MGVPNPSDNLLALPKDNFLYLLSFILLDKMIQKIEFSQEQKEALKKLKIKNEENIKKIEKVLTTYQKQIENLDDDSKTFWGIMKYLEESHSHYPLGHFADYYYSDFKKPLAESFLSEFGEKNAKFNQITEEDKKELDAQLNNEEAGERQRDAGYWRPLRKELETMRRKNTSKA